jgi:hypothetical protein
MNNAETACQACYGQGYSPMMEPLRPGKKLYLSAVVSAAAPAKNLHSLRKRRERKLS